MNYSALRHFADSWGLLFMLLCFVGFMMWTFRKGAADQHNDAANLIFKGDDDD